MTAQSLKNNSVNTAADSDPLSARLPGPDSFLKDHLKQVSSTITALFAVAHLARAALAGPDVQLDRGLTNSASSDGHPGQLASQSYSTFQGKYNGTIACTVFTNNAATGVPMYFEEVIFGSKTDPSDANKRIAVTNYSNFHMIFNLWTNGVDGFISSPTNAHYSVSLGSGPANPVPFGSTTNAGVVFPTTKLSIGLGHFGSLPVLEKGKKYAAGISFLSTNNDEVVRVSQVTTNFPSSDFTFTYPNIITNSPTPVAMAVSAATQQGAIEIQKVGTNISLTTPDIAHSGIYTVSTLGNTNWTLVPGSATTNKVTLPANQPTAMFRERVR